MVKNRQTNCLKIGKSICMKTVVMALSLLLAAVSAGAQTVEAWNLNGTVSATTLATGVHNGTVTLGPSIGSGQFNAGSEYFGEDGWSSGALDQNAYLQIPVAPNSGYFLVLNSITLTMRHSTTGTAAGSGPLSWSLRSSLDGYASDLATGTLTTSYQNFTVSLPSAFQTTTGTIRFRVYGYNQVTTTGGSNRFVFDNISISGSSIAGTLALHSLKLTARPVGKEIGLQWSAEGADPGTQYSIERSGDGSQFGAIGETEDSVFMDGSAPAGSDSYYRVKAVTPDGESIYSNIVRIAGAGTSTASIKSVMAQGASLQALLHFAGAGACQVSIWSRDGKALYRQALEVQSGDQSVQLAAGTWPHGIYVLTVTANGTNSSKLFAL